MRWLWACCIGWGVNGDDLCLSRCPISTRISSMWVSVRATLPHRGSQRVRLGLCLMLGLRWLSGWHRALVAS